MVLTEEKLKRTSSYVNYKTDNMEDTQRVCFDNLKYHAFSEVIITKTRFKDTIKYRDTYLNKIKKIFDFEFDDETITVKNAGDYYTTLVHLTILRPVFDNLDYYDVPYHTGILKNFCEAEETENPLQDWLKVVNKTNKELFGESTINTNHWICELGEQLKTDIPKDYIFRTDKTSLYYFFERE